MLSVKNISYKIDNKALLENICVDFEAGKLNLIIGPNGAGKTTLIKIICSQITTRQGGVYFDDKNINTYSLSELASIRAVLSQNIELSFPLTVSEIVMMGRYPHFSVKPTSIDETACEEAMCFFDIIEFRDRNYMTLSGGEKQRVHFARLMAQIWFPVKNSHRYLILDEPLTFLDVRYQFDFMRKLTKLLQRQRDIVIIGVVHDLNLAAKFGNYLVLLHHGNIMAMGNKHEVLTEENIRDVYQIESVIRKEKDDLHIFFK